MSLTGKILRKSSSSGIGLVRDKEGKVFLVNFNTKHVKKKIPIGSTIVSYKSGLYRIYK